MDRLTKEQRKKNMKANKSAGTKPEKMLAKALFSKGYRYRKNDSKIFGTPDISFRGIKLAIFVDGEFWHGKDWDVRKHDHKTNKEFWLKKIEKNIERDNKVNETLKKDGWTVVRFWSKEVEKNLEYCVSKIEKIINDLRKKNKHKKNQQLQTQLKKMDRTKAAILSHYIHNKDNGVAKTFENEALKILDEIFGTNTHYKDSPSKVAEKYIQYGLFDEFENVPFPSPKNPKFKFIDLFAGIGGFRLALQNLGGKCVFSSEWDKDAQLTYKVNFGEIPFGDITKEETKKYIPDNFDLLCAGFPCQAFSIAGKRGGFEDTRGTLFFEIADILKRKQPKAFFLENVKGLQNHDKGRTLATILFVLRNELGYYVPDPQIINAKDFGVPQNRERIFIVGFHPSTGIKEFQYPKPGDIKVTFADIKEKEVPPTKYYLSTKYLETLRNHKKRHANKGNGFGFEIINDDCIANAIVCGGMGRERNLVIDKRLKDFTPMTRIKGEVNREGIRRMTPREWARLQGFPDTFIIPVSDASAYKQFGNSVAIPAIQATAEEILKRLNLI